MKLMQASCRYGLAKPAVAVAIAGATPPTPAMTLTPGTLITMADVLVHLWGTST